MKRLLNLSSLFTLILVLAGIVSAQEIKQASAATNLPTAAEIFDKYIQATGGKEAHEKIKNRVVKGTAELPAMSLNGTFETANVAPNKSLVILNLSGFGEVVN